MTTERDLRCFCAKLDPTQWPCIHCNRTPPKPDRITALEAENAALREALSDDSELLTIAWMDGSHRSTKAHRDRITALIAAGDRLYGFTDHYNECDWADRERCECGLTDALKAWREVSGHE